MIQMKYVDVAYLVLHVACICIADHYSFTNQIIDYSKGNPTPSGPILTECKPPKTLVSSSVEA